MEVKLRKANIEDAYRIQYVAAHSWKETYESLLPDEYLDFRISNIDNKVESTKKFLQNYQGNYYVLEIDNLVVGILTYDISKEEDYLGYGHIGALYLLKEYQGLGLGKLMFKHAVKELFNLGVNKMYLECMKGNDTIEFYKKYTGTITKEIDYEISSVGSVPAEIVEFDNLYNIIEIMEKGSEINERIHNK